MKGDFHVRFCERLAGETPAYLLDRNWGVKVITRISVRHLTAGDNPNCVQSNPNFAKPPGRCTTPADSAAHFVSEKIAKFDSSEKLLA